MRLGIVTKILLLCIASILLASCASRDRPVYYFDEVLIVNNSKESIRDVSISVPATGGRFGCANIAPLGICANKFPRRAYQYRPIRIDWIYGGKARRSDSFVVEVPPAFDSGQVMRAVFDISPEGKISAFFQQKAPGQ